MGDMGDLVRRYICLQVITTVNRVVLIKIQAKVLMRNIKTFRPFKFNLKRLEELNNTLRPLAGKCVAFQDRFAEPVNKLHAFFCGKILKLVQIVVGFNGQRSMKSLAANKLIQPGCPSVCFLSCHIQFLIKCAYPRTNSVAYVMLVVVT